MHLRISENGSARAIDRFTNTQLKLCAEIMNGSISVVDSDPTLLGIKLLCIPARIEVPNADK